MPFDSNFLKENNAKYQWHPMAHPGDMQANPPKIICSAEGITLTDVDGHKCIDAVGGLWNVNLGYSVEPIKKAIADQLQELPYYSSFRGTSTDVSIHLSTMLQEWFAPDGLSRAFFTSGGSDSVETALRLSRQYHKIKGEKDRFKFISLKKGYHGTHFGGASVNGNANFRRNYEPLMPGCFQVASPYTYRNPFNETDPAKLADLVVANLADEIAFQGADTIAAFIMEPVLGAGGVIVPHETLMPKIRDLCTKHGILLIADEVITAFGRTGGWTGSRLWGVQPDFMCTAKAITNGYYPFGAVMIHQEVAEVFETAPGAEGMIGHGYTYSAHPVGAAAAVACIAEIDRLDVAANARVRGPELLAGLQALKEKYEVVGDVRGKGLMCCMELVENRDTKEPLSKDRVAKAFEAAYNEGCLIRVSGPNMIFSPPLIITEADVKTMLACAEAGLAAIS